MADLDDTTNAPQRGARRRDVLLGATGIAAAVAITGALGEATAHAATAGPMAGQIESLGSFEVLAFSWGASNSSTASGSGGGAGKATIQDVSFTKYVDAISPLLFHAVATGQHLQSATITFVGKGAPTVTLQLTTVVVTSLSTGGSSGEARLTENITLNAASITFTVDSVSSSS
jgi:type VI protein secretion system component Hcp